MYGAPLNTCTLGGLGGRPGLPDRAAATGWLRTGTALDLLAPVRELFC